MHGGRSVIVDLQKSEREKALVDFGLALVS